MQSYKSVIDAARGLLGEVSLILGASGTEHVVVGGWSPYILNSDPIQHPGTKDVDVLFAEGATEKSLASAANALIEHGYLPNAKHPFQLLRTLLVKDTKLVFNVDFLHPLETSPDGLQPDLFVDHLELDVPLGELPENYRVKSIATPHAGFIVEDKQYVEVDVVCRLPDMTEQVVPVSLMNEVGLLVTKSHSVNTPKRLRDPFDIYLAIAQSRNYEDMLASFREMEEKRESAFLSLLGIRRAISTQGPFGTAVERFIPEVQRVGTPLWKSDPYSETVSAFLDDVGLTADNTGARKV